MKKKILGVITIVAIALAVALNVNMKTNDYGLSDLALNNVEALANINPYPPPNWGVYSPATDNCGNFGSSMCDKSHW